MRHSFTSVIALKNAHNVINLRKHHDHISQWHPKYVTKNNHKIASGNLAHDMTTVHTQYVTKKVYPSIEQILCKYLSLRTNCLLVKHWNAVTKTCVCGWAFKDKFNFLWTFRFNHWLVNRWITFSYCVLLVCWVSWWHAVAILVDPFSAKMNSEREQMKKAKRKEKKNNAQFHRKIWNTWYCNSSWLSQVYKRCRNVIFSLSVATSNLFQPVCVCFFIAFHIWMYLCFKQTE